MASQLLPSPLPDEHLVDYVRRMSEPERKIFVAALVNRHVHALGPIEIARLASRRRAREQE